MLRSALAPGRRARRPRRRWNCLALDRARSSMARIGSLEPVEPSRQERLDRRRNSQRRQVAGAIQPPSSLAQRAVLDEHGESSSTKSGRPSAASAISFASVAPASSARPTRIGHRAAPTPRRRVARGAPRSHRRFPPPHVMRSVEQLGAGEAEDEERGISHLVRRCSRRDRETRLRPVDVVEDDARAGDHAPLPRRVAGPPNCVPLWRRNASAIPIISATRSTIELCVGRRQRAAATTLLRAPLRSVASSNPAASVIASFNGQYVIPSPYGRHRPRATTSPRAGCSARNSSDEPRLADPGFGRAP